MGRGDELFPEGHGGVSRLELIPKTSCFTGIIRDPIRAFPEPCSPFRPGRRGRTYDMRSAMRSTRWMLMAAAPSPTQSLHVGNENDVRGAAASVR